MKRLLLIVLPLLLIVGCSKPISEETLIDKDGLKYHPETKELYSGKVFKNRMGGKKEFEGSYKDGDSTGIWTHWYENGQKNYEVTFKDGKKDGLWTSWYENGQKKSELKYNNGIVGLIYYFSIQGDTLISNDNNNMELKVNDYKLVLNGNWLVDKNNSITVLKDDGKELTFEFNEQTLLVKVNGELQESDVVVIDYNQMSFMVGGNKIPISLTIIDVDNVDFKVSEDESIDILRLVRINNYTF